MNAIVKHEASALAMTDGEIIGVLQSSLYPGAALPSIKMVLEYCRAANLDPMQKPVHIVPMWNQKEKRMVDVIMPGVNLYRTQAARSGSFAGMSEPEFGPDVVAKLGGVEISYPEWCRVTVKRVLTSGIVAEFTAREYWIENYAVKGGQEKSIAPNAMWLKRPRGQIAKCASAQALRVAFPEIASQPTADEMEGKSLYVSDEAAIDSGFSAARLQELISHANTAPDETWLTAIWADGVAEIKVSGDHHAHAAFKAAVSARGAALRPQKIAAPEVPVTAEAMADFDHSYVPE
jgi:phage recombination protein Bet